MKEVAIKAGTLLTVHGYQTEDGLWTVRLIGEEDNTFTGLNDTQMEDLYELLEAKGERVIPS